ncbi:MAG TPA: CYCXC family (seleno)protein [Pyrinomonadaceae bacterium]|nr:CYCXC family (seleno)protein [Pyrinomonadaceae bacterium]
MKTRYLFILIAILAIGAGGLLLIQSRQQTARENDLSAQLLTPLPQDQGHTHAARVPAYQAATEVNQLGVTLPPVQFFGKTREAYQAAKEIPKTLAQLPCYCECDRGFGHKSLHSCFEDEHASHCAVCVDEALLAYRLQKEEKLTPEQVREKIIAQYSSSHSSH